MINAIAFDLDHTLYDRNATWCMLTNCFLKQFKKSLIPELTEETLLHILQESDYRATYDESGWEGMYQILVETGILSETAEFEAFRSFIWENFPGAIVPYEDTHSVLRWCRNQGLRPSLITNGHPDLQQKKLESIGLTGWFTEYIICDPDTGIPCKPATKPFLDLAKSLELKPEQILYVGDNPRNDIEGARNAGMKTVWLSVMNNWDRRYAPADYEIANLSGLFDIIESITANRKREMHNEKIGTLWEFV